ncbi:MAG TPA: biotin/lipoyl-containing protein, partial [Propionibacteriaceae bacterium]|nr:biotin/lipoyl-containing protein [Propionibacteriaceae bacterium]
MSTSVTLPALGESVTEGTVSRWLKQVGDTVEADEPLLEVSTDKVDTEIPSPTSGVLLEIKAAEDETVEVGAVLAVIGDPDEAGGGGGPSDDADQTSGAAEETAVEEAPVEPEPEPSSAADAERMEQAESEPSDDGQGGQPSGGGGGAASGTEITLPALGESVTEGTVSRWLKQVGDSVEADEPLLEVSTDKVDTEIPSPTSGTLLEIRVQEDETVAVGEVLAVVGEAGAVAPSPAEAEPQPTAKAEP